MGLLDSIECPDDLKKLNRKELKLLADEIRQELVVTVSQNGGHLAPNLGVVELTLALHLTFKSPQDKIIWDVGHQSYVHKLLTGRKDVFRGLRKLDGLSGFPKRCESVHDVFETGHSSTSVSAALGMALARDLKKEKHHIIAVIGDGALTGGEAFEALNHAGHLQTNLIVVLNDNEMSIANNVGAMATYLTKLRTQPAYFRSKEEMEQLLSKIPRIGSKVLQALDRVKDAVKFMILPGMLFEELGFTYLGPVDGHSLDGVRNMLNYASQVSGPTLVHVVTRKGKGYQPAEQNPDKFHGIGPFKIESGEAVKNTIYPTYTEVFGETLVRLAKEDPKIIAITAAMTSGTGLDRFSETYPERFFDVGIAEQHAVTLAAGLAQSGYHPVLAVYSTFLQRAYDQVLHDVCLQNLPVTMAVDRAGLVGEDGATHQGVFDISYLRHIPNITVMAPRDENQLQHCIYTALSLKAPCAVRYPRGIGVGIERESKPRILPIGSLEVLKEGRELLIIGVGPTVYSCLEAAKLMQRQGVDAAVVDIRFVKPLDSEALIKLIRTINRVVTVEEHVLAGGAGSAVLEMISNRVVEFEQVPDVMCLGLPDQFIEHGSVAQLREKYNLTPEAITDKVFKKWPVLYRNGKVARIRARK